MPRTSLFGVPLAWSCEGLAADPIARLLEALDPPDLQEPAEPPGLQIILRPATSEAAADPLAEGARPSFFQGVVQAYRVEPPSAEPPSPPTFLLWDRASRVSVRLGPGEPLIEASIAPEDREPAPGSALGMLQIALSLALRCHGLFHLHAAALVHPSGAGVLLAGGSGAGKTTATLALLEANLLHLSSNLRLNSYSYLGDDSLFLRLREGTTSVLAFPRPFHLGPETLAAFPRLRPLAGPEVGARGKLALDPRLAFPGRFRPAMEAPAIVLLPQIHASLAESSIAPVSQADAAGALIASSAALFIDGFPGRSDNLSLLPKLLPRAGSFELTLGRDALAAPAPVIASLLERALAHARPADVAKS